MSEQTPEPKALPSHDLATVAGFLAALSSATNPHFAFRNPGVIPLDVGDLWCPRCGGRRRVALRVMWAAPGNQSGTSYPNTVEALTPSLFDLKCVQCGLGFHAAIVASGSGPLMMVSPAMNGGLSTPHAPDTVRFFLDQAARAEIAGGTGAALTMYRSAVEAVLHEQGFHARMLGPKLAELEASIAKGSAPRWTQDFGSEFLAVLKNLGNASTHVDNVDVDQLRAALTLELLSDVRLTVSELLELVYERPKRSALRLTRMKTAHTDIKGK